MNLLACVLLALGVTAQDVPSTGQRPKADRAGAKESPRKDGGPADKGSGKSGPSKKDAGSAKSKGSPGENEFRAMMAEAKKLAEKAPPDFKTGEAGDMLKAILSGSRMGNGDGWFKPSKTKFGYDWVIKNFDANKDGGVTKEEWSGPGVLFERLDRDRNGVVKRDDFDWSDNAPYLRQLQQASQFTYRIDPNSNGRISKEEWDKFFERASNGKDYLTADDLRASLLTMPQPPAGSRREQGPTPPILVKGLLNGELGSHKVGPAIGDYAPDFTLKTHDGKRTINFAQHRGSKPAVLIFGSFT